MATPNKYKYIAKKFDLAQMRAALPIEQGGLGLPPNNTAMDRAKAMGYTVPLWHSSPSPDIHKFNPKSWFADRPEISETYLQKGKEGSTMYPVLINPEGFGEVDFGGAVWNQGPIADITVNGVPRGSVGRNRSFSTTDSVARVSEELGYPGAKISNVIDRGPNFWATPIKGGDVHVVHDPSRIRSRFAAFDPFRRGEADILASHPIATTMAAGGLSGLANKYLDQPMNMGPDVARVAKETGIQPMSRGEALKNAISAVPGIGDALAAAEGLQGAAEGDWKKAGLGALAAAPMMGAIKTYHMTPHTFDKFDLSKAKTGLGGTMLGKGIYTTDNPKHAAEWIEQLSPEMQSRAKVLDVDLQWPEAAKEAITPMSPSDYLHYQSTIDELPDEIKQKILEEMHTNPQGLAKLLKQWSAGAQKNLTIEDIKKYPIGPIIKYMGIEQNLGNKGIPGVRVPFESTEFVTFDPSYTKINK
jgi:hypothetical protein